MRNGAFRVSNVKRSRAAGAVLALALTAGLAGAAGASTPPDSAPSVYSAIVPHAFASHALADSDLYSRQVAGGTTTVPDAATSVQLQVTVSGGTANGDLKIYPNGGSTGSVDNLRWAVGQTVTTQFVVGVGTGEKVSFKNGPGAATLDLSITGYYAPVSVTPANISAGGSSSGQVLTSDGSAVSWQTPPYEGKLTNSVVVHPTGNTTTDGNALRSAVALGEPLVVLEPGTYQLGNSPLVLPGGVSLTGGGPQNTFILSTGASTAISANGNQTISGLSIAADGGASSMNAIDVTAGTVTLSNDAVSVTGSALETTVRVLNSGSLLVQESTLTASTSGVFTQAVLVNQSTASATILDSTLTVTVSGTSNQGLGVNAFGTSTIRDSAITVTSSGGALAEAVDVQGSTLATVFNSQVIGSNYALLALSGTIQAASSEISGVAHANAGQTITCVGDFGATFVALSTVCS